ncbi:unnamed protein product, partial [Brachionus calyciflorus]
DKGAEDTRLVSDGCDDQDVVNNVVVVDDWDDDDVVDDVVGVNCSDKFWIVSNKS